MIGINKKFTEKMLETFNPEHDICVQIDILQEECSECIQALSKYKRGKDKDLVKVKEEISHVYMSLDTFLTVTKIPDIDIIIDKEVDTVLQGIDILQTKCASMIIQLHGYKCDLENNRQFILWGIKELLLWVSIARDLLGISEEDIQNEVLNKIKQYNFNI